MAAHSGPAAALPLGRRSLARLVARILVYLGGGLFLLPLFWMVTSSLKPEHLILAVPPRWLPIPPRWQNYVEALTYVPFGRYALNTLLISAITILGHALSCTVVAYGFARLRAPGRDSLFIVLLATMMLPYPVTMVPLYVLFTRLGWVNSFLPLTVPAFFGHPFYIFLLRQFLLTIPRDYEEAARVDGASLTRILWHIILPLAAPAMATLAVFTFQGAWNDFLGPLIYLHRQTLYTVSLGLAFFRATYTVRWGYLMAASLVTVLPVLVVFMLAQRAFVEGITVSGVKG